MVNGKEGNSVTYPKTYIITAAQAIQSEKHANMYGEDDSKGAPNVRLIENMDSYAEMIHAETMILQMQGMDCEEIHMNDFFEDRADVYINKNKLARLEMQREREIEKIETQIEITEEKIERATDKKDTSRKKDLESSLKELEKEFQSVRDTTYFNSIGVIPLNEKVVVADLIVPPQNVDPTTGRLDIAQNQLGKTVIFAHSKQRLRCAPKSVGIKLPRLLMTTGAVTYPNYNTTNNRGDVAFGSHKYGFVIVDVLSSRRYLPRIVPAMKNGTFVDMGIEHRPGEKPKRMGVEALVLGDIHLGDDNPDTMKANYEMIDYFSPKNVFLHDALNGHSMNPHEREDTIKRAIAFREGRLDIKKEFSEAYDEFIKSMAKRFPRTNFWFVYSNHSPDFIRRYLTECQFIYEPWNDTEFTSALRAGLLKDQGSFEKSLELNPLQRGLELIAEEVRMKLPHNVHFLSLNEGMILKGCQLGIHGHKGKNGARGSPNAMKEGYGKIISGHTHTPEINGDSYVVGTSSIIPLDYQMGQPGTSMPANAVLYSNGLIQLLPVIIGRWIK